MREKTGSPTQSFTAPSQSKCLLHSQTIDTLYYTEMYMYVCTCSVYVSLQMFCNRFFFLLWPLFGTPWANYIVQCGISQKSAAMPWSGKNTVVANNLVIAAACQSCAQLCVFISVYCLFKVKMISQLFTLYCTLCMHH